MKLFFSYEFIKDDSCQKKLLKTNLLGNQHEKHIIKSSS